MWTEFKFSQWLKALFPNRLQRAIVLFSASLLLTVSIAACGGSAPSIKSLAKISADTMAPAAATTGVTLDRIAQTGIVRIAVPDDFPPFGSVGKDMKPRGYDIDVANAVATGLDAKLTLVPVIGNYRIPFLQTDRVDLVISSLGKNKERALIIDFSEPYAPFFSGIYGGSEIQISSLEDLKGKTVGVAQGSLEDLEVSKQPFANEIDLKRFANNSLTASALVSGQVQAIATGNVVAAKLIRDNPAQKIENKFVMKNSPCYVGVRKGDTKLLERVNQILADMKQTGKLNEFSLAWFGEPLPDLTPPPA